MAALLDATQDGFLDLKEVEALVQREATRLHSVNGEVVDPLAVREEMARMRVHIMAEVDVNKDMLVSEAEFVTMAKSDAFKRDSAWKPLNVRPKCL